MPGALLTMNREFFCLTPIKEINLSSFTMKIVPNGGQKVPVVVLNNTGGMAKIPTSPKNWFKWTAYVSDSYNLEVPFPSDSKEFQSAWQFIYWYIKKGFPLDWNFIANKPENVDWNSIESELQSSGQQIQDSSIETQKKIWSLYPMDWYAKMVKKVY